MEIILAIVNEAAVAYRGVIPWDCWQDPYMATADLERDVAHGVAFIGAEIDGELAAVMGVQTVGDANLIRHAYVHPTRQRRGLGAALLRDLLDHADRQVLVGTWADADWAVSFYQRNGFTLVDPDETDALLRRYWDVPERQRKASVVLARRRSA